MKKVISGFISFLYLFSCTIDGLDRSKEIVAFCFIPCLPVIGITVYLVGKDCLPLKKQNAFSLEHGQVIF